VLFSLFEEEILHERRALDHYLTYGAESYAEALNYFPATSEFYLGPEEYLEHIRKTKAAVDIPIIGSLNGVSPGGWISYARKIESAGAEALVLFNRFYQPDIDLENLEVVPNVILSTPQSMRLPLRSIAILYGRIKADLAATSGIHTAQDVLKMLMVGANVTMMASALLHHGVGHSAKSCVKWKSGWKHTSMNPCSKCKAA